MVEKRNRLRVTREGSLLSGLIDIEISDQTVERIRAALHEQDSIEDEERHFSHVANGGLPCSDLGHDHSVHPEMERYQRESR